MSSVRCTGATRSSSGHGGDMVSGGRSSAATGYGLELANARGERGVLHGGSPRSCREGQWARGRAGVAEFDGERRRAEAWE